MDIDQDRSDLRKYAEGHRQRIDHLRARIERSTRELHLHETIRGLAENSHLPDAVRSLAEMTGTESATSSKLRDFLAERGVSISTEFDIGIENTGDNFKVTAKYRDEWFPAELSWSSQEGFFGRIVNNTWRDLRATTSTEDR